MTEPTTPLSINLKGRLTLLDRPLVMGILNATPDSFYANSRHTTSEQIAQEAMRMVNEGADIIDVGGYSSRPGAADISEAEEMQRLRIALEATTRSCPDTPISVDTFRASIAKACVEEYGVAMINDISGGELDKQMFETVVRLRVPYVMMHMQGTPQTMQQHTSYTDVVAAVMQYFAQRVDRLAQLGATDIILDPGFGFSKTIAHNYQLLQSLTHFDIFGLPLLVGISRKSMIYKLLDTTPQEALTGTTVLNTLALAGGAHILRVHDVKEAVTCVQLVQAMQHPNHINI